MNILRNIFRKNNQTFKKIKKMYPPCGREFCYCIKTTDLKEKKNVELYFECYRTWYNYME